MIRAILAIATVLVLAAPLGCREEGPAERAGRRVDAAVEKLREGSEGTLERLGRELDEVVEETKESAEEARDAR